MRVTPAMFVGLVALATVSVQAAPNKANWVDLGVTPPLDSSLENRRPEEFNNCDG
jgi:hypothetical protein